MAKRIPSRVIVALAKQLLESGKVWKGVGRKPTDDQRPTLIQELCRITELKRAAIHRVLAGQSRSARNRRLEPAADLREINVSQTVSHRARPPSRVPAPLPQGLSSVPGRTTTAPSAGGGSLHSPPRDRTNIATTIGKGEYIPPREPPAQVSQAAKQLMGRGLDAIGLRVKSSGHEAIRGQHITSDQSIIKEARRAAQDGIEWFLSVGNPPPTARRVLEESLTVLGTFP